jgi:pimeloyl-ACP methyl ester carboxylesterase
MGKIWKKIVLVLVRIGFLVFCGLALVLFFFQASLIYHPRRYPPNSAHTLPPGWQALRFTTSQGEQTAFYKIPSQPLRRVWVFFGGNGSLALDWTADRHLIPPDDAALLVEYPSYGCCEGKPTPATILENSIAASQAFAQRLKLTPADFDAKLNIVGHSLGCAAALQFAARQPVERIVLFAPFTSMVAMARRTVGWPLCELCRHRFNNEARLRELSERARPPRVTIFHGSDDEVIPVAMGRKLAAEFPAMIEFHEVPRAGHNSVLIEKLPALGRILRAP